MPGRRCVAIETLAGKEIAEKIHDDDREAHRLQIQPPLLREGFEFA